MLGILGEDCESACKRAGLFCRADFAWAINSCKALEAASGGRCGRRKNDCVKRYYGPDLPALVRNELSNTCLINSKPRGDFATRCKSANPFGERLCPCGPSRHDWLTPEYIANVLRPAGGWDSVPGTIASLLQPQRTKQKRKTRKTVGEHGREKQQSKQKQHRNSAKARSQQKANSRKAGWNNNPN